MTLERNGAGVDIFSLGIKLMWNQLSDLEKSYLKESDDIYNKFGMTFADVYENSDSIEELTQVITKLASTPDEYISLVGGIGVHLKIFQMMKDSIN